MCSHLMGTSRPPSRSRGYGRFPHMPCLALPCPLTSLPQRGYGQFIGVTPRLLKADTVFWLPGRRVRKASMERSQRGLCGLRRQWCSVPCHLYMVSWLPRRQALAQGWAGFYACRTFLCPV